MSKDTVEFQSKCPRRTVFLPTNGFFVFSTQLTENVQRKFTWNNYADLEHSDWLEKIEWPIAMIKKLGWRKFKLEFSMLADKGDLGKSPISICSEIKLMLFDRCWPKILK